MIEPILPPECYTEKIWFDREQDSIFKKLWLFVGFEQQLRNENDYIAREVSGVPVLVQRMDGEVRAFHNACAHRGMPLQLEQAGNRKLICPYHGWSFHANGQLRGIPNEEIYQFSEQCRGKISLKSYAVKLVGNFVFVNLNSNPLPIENQFSEDLLLLLEESSKYFADEFSYTKFLGQYNWKLNFENILDWNHVQFVHRATFASSLSSLSGGGFDAAGCNESSLFSTGSKLSNFLFSPDVRLDANIDLRAISRSSRCAMEYHSRWFSSLLEKSVDPGAIFVNHLFPNMSFGSIHGEHFYVQQFVPVTPNTTEFHSWVFTAKFKEGISVQPHLLWGIHHAEKKVIDEDMVLLNALQRALKSAASVGVMGAHEAPLAAIGSWYMKNVKDQ